MTQENYKLFMNGLEGKERGEDVIYCKREGLPEEVSELLSSIAFDISEEVGGLDLPYKILNNALEELSDNCEDIKDLADYDSRESTPDGFCSVYTWDRLQLLNVHNQADISEVMKEYGYNDIADACAVWYDNQVYDAIDLIKNKLNNENI